MRTARKLIFEKGHHHVPRHLGWIAMRKFGHLILCLVLGLTGLVAEELDPNGPGIPDDKSKTPEELRKELDATMKRQAALRAALQVAESDRRLQAEFEEIQALTQHRIEEAEALLSNKEIPKKGAGYHKAHLSYVRSINAIDIKIKAVPSFKHMNKIRELLAQRGQKEKSWREVESFHARWKGRLDELSENKELSPSVKPLLENLEEIRAINQSLLDQRRKSERLQKQLIKNIEALHKQGKQ